MSDPAKLPDSTAPRSCRRRVLRIATVLFILLGVGLVAVYRYIVKGGLRARQTPSAIETSVARWLVDVSIPKEAKAQVNPLSKSAEAGDVAAGRELYQKIARPATATMAAAIPPRAAGCIRRRSACTAPPS